MLIFLYEIEKAKESIQERNHRALQEFGRGETNQLWPRDRPRRLAAVPTLGEEPEWLQSLLGAFLFQSWAEIQRPFFQWHKGGVGWWALAGTETTESYGFSLPRFPLLGIFGSSTDFTPPPPGPLLMVLVLGIYRKSYLVHPINILLRKINSKKTNYDFVW